MTFQSRQNSAVAIAMLCSGLVTAQFVGGKAARDALFLAQIEVTSLPMMVILTSLVSIALVTAHSRGVTRFSPARFVPTTFAVSAGLLLVEWLLTTTAPTVAAVLVYLHLAGLGPVLGSGFWLVASERFDPRTARLRYGHIAGAGTLGGLLGGLIAERLGVWFGVTAVLPFLAALNLVGAWAVHYLATAQLEGDPAAPDAAAEQTLEGAPSGLRVLTEVPYIRNLAALVLLGTTSAALLDYLFKVEAVNTFGRGQNLLRFFAIYYAATSVLTFVIQASASRFVLQRFGLALATSLPSIALFAGGVIGLLVPGFRSVTGARGGESIFRGSLFRFGYELFYTPIPAREKRAVKSIIDVGVDRLGDAVGAGLIALVLVVGPAGQYSTILYLGLAVSGAAIILASRLNGGYVHTLENSLRNRAIDIDLSDAQDFTTRTTILRTLGDVRSLAPARHDVSRPAQPTATLQSADPDLQDIMALRSRDRERIAKVLRRDEGMSATLVPHVIPLLAWSPVSADAVFALRKVAEERIGALVDALIDPNQDFAVRRRLARVFSVCVSQRAADGLMRGLEDARFEVRFQCGRSLSAVQQTNPLVQIDREAIINVILSEMAVSRSVWESRRLLDALESQDGVSFVDDFVRDRAGQSLGHVFTLLSLVLPKEPLQIAYRGLHAGDQQLRGTALEYLEEVLPSRVRNRLWPFLEDHRPSNRTLRPRDEILADLLLSNESIMVNIEELKRRRSGA